MLPFASRCCPNLLRAVFLHCCAISWRPPPKRTAISFAHVGDLAGIKIPLTSVKTLWSLLYETDSCFNDDIGSCKKEKIMAGVTITTWHQEGRKIGKMLFVCLFGHVMCTHQTKLHLGVWSQGNLFEGPPVCMFAHAKRYLRLSKLIVCLNSEIDCPFCPSAPTLFLGKERKEMENEIPTETQNDSSNYLHRREQIFLWDVLKEQYEKQLRGTGESTSAAKLWSVSGDCTGC